MHRKTATLLFAVSLFIIQPSAAFAQDTFGPICDGVTVTCPPSPPPDTQPPAALQPTTPPGEPPRSGHAETLLMFLGLSGMCFGAGLFLRRSYIEA